jgi:RimJ/RimL family protein N-acetyltransferase
VRFRIDWTTDVGQLAAIEASLADVATHAAALAAGYNHPANAELMGHTEPIDPTQVVESYAELIEDGGRAFLLHRDGELAGDGDLRHLRDGGAEFAFMIGAPAAQGRGLGTRFAIMIHAFGFREAGLHHIYASIVPHNTASRRVFDKLGYVVDDGPIARGFADEPGDVVMAIDRATFERVHGAALGQIRIAAIPRLR